MCALSLDIFRDIFLRSSAESLIRFRAVCKWWRAAIDDPCFVKTHTEQQQQLPSTTTILFRNESGHPFHPLYSLDLQTLDFTNGLQSLPAAPLNITRDGLSRLPTLPVSICNGLMLIPPSGSDEESNWEIWNILTHERLQLPRLDSSAVDGWTPSGLGYDAATDDYKAVVIISQESKTTVHHSHVYSLRSDSWRKIANFPCLDPRIAYRNGVFLGGALHWVTWQGVVALDMTTESYRQLDLPRLHERCGEHYSDLRARDFGIHEVGGCLMLSDEGTHDGYDKHFDMWVMKDMNGTWMELIASTRSYRAAYEFYMRPVAYTNNKMQILMQDCDSLYLFDVESHSRKVVSIPALLSTDVDTQAFRGSIFRLHHNCGRVNGGGSFSTETSRIKTTDIETELIFCLRGNGCMLNSHYDCFSLDSNCCYSSTEDEEEQ